MKYKRMFNGGAIPDYMIVGQKEPVFDNDPAVKAPPSRGGGATGTFNPNSGYAGAGTRFLRGIPKAFDRAMDIFNPNYFKGAPRDQVTVTDVAGTTTGSLPSYLERPQQPMQGFPNTGLNNALNPQLDFTRPDAMGGGESAPVVAQTPQTPTTPITENMYPLIPKYEGQPVIDSVEMPDVGLNLDQTIAPIDMQSAQCS